jgi:hypothetical protein
MRANEPKSLGWVGDRLPGDPRYIRLLARGEVALPALVSARARWEARQANHYNDKRTRARMLLSILNQLVAETEGEFLRLTVAELRNRLTEWAQ